MLTKVYSFELLSITEKINEEKKAFDFVLFVNFNEVNNRFEIFMP